MDIFNTKNWVYEEYEKSFDEELNKKEILFTEEFLNNIKNDIKIIIEKNIYSYTNILEIELKNYLNNLNIKNNIIFNGLNEFDIYLNDNHNKIIFNTSINKKNI